MRGPERVSTLVSTGADAKDHGELGEINSATMSSPPTETLFMAAPTAGISFVSRAASARRMFGAFQRTPSPKTTRKIASPIQTKASAQSHSSSTKTRTTPDSTVRIAAGEMKRGMARSVSSMSHLSSEVPEASPSALAGKPSSRRDLRALATRVPSRVGTPILAVASLAAIVV